MEKEVYAYLTIISILILVSSFFIVGIAHKFSEREFDSKLNGNLVNTNIELSSISVSDMALAPPEKIEFIPAKINITKPIIIKASEPVQVQEYKKKSRRKIEKSVIELVEQNQDVDIELLVSVSDINDKVKQDLISAGAKIKDEFEVGDIIAVSIPSKNLDKLNDLQEIVGVSNDHEYHVFLTESIPQLGSTFLVDRNLTGKNVTVAILDSGLDTTGHTIFNGRVVGQTSTADADPTSDGIGHGTHVAGTFANVSPDADILNVKVFDNVGAGSSSSIISGINWAVANGADVISMSLGSFTVDNAVHDAVDAAINSGVIVVAASGNCGPATAASQCGGYEGVVSPGIHEPVITVGAVDTSGNYATYSSGDDYGTYIKPDIVAPGSSITATKAGGGTQSRSGTSMATPHVSAVVAMLLEHNASSQATMKSLLESTATDKGNASKDSEYGSGYINVSEAYAKWIDLTKFRHSSLIHQDIGEFTYLDVDNTTAVYNRSGYNVTVDIYEFDNQSAMLESFGVNFNTYILNDIEVDYFIGGSNTKWFVNNTIYNITHNGNNYSDIFNGYISTFNSSVLDYIQNQTAIKHATTDDLILTRINSHNLDAYNVTYATYTNGSLTTNASYFNFTDWDFDFKRNIYDENLVDYVFDNGNIYWLHENIVYNLTENISDVFTNYSNVFDSNLSAWLQVQIDDKNALTDKLLLKKLGDFSLDNFTIQGNDQFANYTNGSFGVDVIVNNVSEFDYDFSHNVNNEVLIDELIIGGNYIWFVNDTLYNISSNGSVYDNYSASFNSSMSDYLSGLIDEKNNLTDLLILRPIADFNVTDFNHTSYVNYTNGSLNVSVLISNFSDFDYDFSHNVNNEVLINELIIDNNYIWFVNDTFYNISSNGTVYDNYSTTFNSTMSDYLSSLIADKNNLTDVLILRPIDDFNVTDFNHTSYVNYTNGSLNVSVVIGDSRNLDYYVNNEVIVDYIVDSDIWWTSNGTNYTVSFNDTLFEAYSTNYSSDLATVISDLINEKNNLTEKLILNSIGAFELLEYTNNSALYGDGTENVSVSIEPFINLSSVVSDFDSLVDVGFNDTYYNDSWLVWSSSDTLYNVSSSGVVFDYYFDNYSSDFSDYFNSAIYSKNKTDLVDVVSFTPINSINLSIGDNYTAFVNSTTWFNFTSDQIGNITIIVDGDTDFDLVTFREGVKNYSNGNESEIVVYEKIDNILEVFDLAVYPFDSSGNLNLQIMSSGIGCIEQVAFACYENDIYWQNSCGSYNEVKETCSYGCDSGSCYECVEDYQCGVGSSCQSNTCVAVSNVTSVNTCTDLVASINANENINITSDLDCTGVSMYTRGTYTNTIEGNGFTISNVAMSWTGDGVGLIRNAEDAVVKNINFDDVSIDPYFYHDQVGRNAGLIFGKVAGDSVIYNVNVTDLYVDNMYYIGGLAGVVEKDDYLTIENVNIAGNVNCRTSCGGIIGNGNGNFDNVHFTGSVKSGDFSTGGLIGSGSLIANNVSFAGSVFGDRNVGGLVGFLRSEWTSDIQLAKVTGTVTGKQDTGGLIGLTHDWFGCSGIVINNSLVNATVKGDLSTGGAVGSFHCPSGKIENVLVKGKVEGKWTYLGGFVGRMYSAGSVRNTVADNTISPQWTDDTVERFGRFGNANWDMSSWTRKWYPNQVTVENAYYIGNETNQGSLGTGLNEFNSTNLIGLDESIWTGSSLIAFD